MQKQAEWILCPVCGNKTRCKQETLIEAENLKVTVIKKQEN